MSTHPEAARAGYSSCWCCGGQFDESNLVRLGSRPEVGVCLGCARYLQRRAAEREDDLNPSRAGQLRGVVRAVREWVIRHGWHRLPVIGSLLQRLDRRLP